MQEKNEWGFTSSVGKSTQRHHATKSMIQGNTNNTDLIHRSSQQTGLTTKRTETIQEGTRHSKVQAVRKLNSNQNKNDIPLATELGVKSQ